MAARLASPKILAVMDEFAAQEGFPTSGEPTSSLSWGASSSEAKPRVLVELGRHISGYSTILCVDAVNKKTTGNLPAPGFPAASVLWRLSRRARSLRTSRPRSSTWPACRALSGSSWGLRKSRCGLSRARALGMRVSTPSSWIMWRSCTNTTSRSARSWASSSPSSSSLRTTGRGLERTSM